MNRVLRLEQGDTGGVYRVGGEDFDGQVPDHGLHIQHWWALPLALLSVVLQGDVHLIHGRDKLKV